VTVAILAMATGASAVAPTYTSHSNNVAAGTSDEVFAVCPDATRTVGGGAFNSGSTVEDEIKSSAPFDGQSDNDTKPDDGWGVAGNASVSGQRSLTAYAICAAGKIKYAGESKEVPKSRKRSVVAECPRRSHILGGGVKAPHNASTEILLLSSFTGPGFPAKTWSGTVQNGSNKDIRMKTWAICGKQPTLLSSVTQGTPGTLAPGTQNSLATPGPGCSQAGDYGVSGVSAQVVGRPRDAEIASLIPSDLDAGTDPDDGAKAWFNNDTVTSQAMKVAATCADF
jgi:hypothetical protein